MDTHTEADRMLPTQVMNEFGASFVHRRIFGAAKGFVTGGPLGAASGFFGGGGAPSPPPASAPFTPTDPCPSGVMILDRCVTGDIPLIDVGPATLPAPFAGPGDVRPGAFGALSVDPVMLSTVRLRCPTGLVLGKDDRCYAQGKGGISNSQRKWPKAPRAIMSAQDGKILRKADAVRGRVKRVAATAGFTCKKK